MVVTIVIVVATIMFSCSETERPSDDETGSWKLLQQRAEEAIMSRAERFSRQDVLVADFYRIYRKLAYPLPVREIYHPSFHVTGIPGYPWEIWMTWDLEQRINSMGWAAHWSGDERLRELVRRDLEALAGWPEYDVWERPHLAGAHCTRIMAGAWRNWDWIGRNLQEKIEKALGRIVDSYPDWLGDGRLELTSVEQILTGLGKIIFTKVTGHLFTRAQRPQIPHAHLWIGAIVLYIHGIVLAAFHNAIAVSVPASFDPAELQCPLDVWPKGLEHLIIT